MDQPRLVEPGDRDGDRSRRMRQAWKRWGTWGNLGFVLAAAVLPMGWLLPLVRLARIRVSTERRRPR